VETKKFIKNLINENIEAKKKMLKSEQVECIYNVADKIVETYRNKKKTIIYSNGDSASDTLYFAAEIRDGRRI
jgi:phosphoheptose isomerase